MSTSVQLQSRPVRRVALLVNMAQTCTRSLIRGVYTYALEHEVWTLRSSPCEPRVISLLRDWKPDGVIATVLDREIGQALVRLRRPVVDTAFSIRGLKLPVVDVDHSVVGRLAAEHLLEQGYVNFGFLGSKSARYSEVSQASFVARLAASGQSTSSWFVEYLYEDFATSSWKKDEPGIAQWVGRLPKPVAIFACNDIAARGLLDICKQLQLHVPEQVAILGADDDDLESLLTMPSISSVAVPAKQVGYEAAKLLARMMSGEHVEDSVFVPPVRVIVRQSTDTRATDDPIVQAALRFIRAHASQNIHVATVAEAVGVGKRDLERTFRRVLNCSVLDDIRGVRVQRVKELLAETDLSMSAIALRSGFSSAQRTAIVFREVVGMAPMVYRRQISAQHSHS